MQRLQLIRDVCSCVVIRTRAASLGLQVLWKTCKFSLHEVSTLYYSLEIIAKFGIPVLLTLMLLFCGMFGLPQLQSSKTEFGGLLELSSKLLGLPGARLVIVLVSTVLLLALFWSHSAFDRIMLTASTSDEATSFL